MTVSVPEKTLEHWLSQYLVFRYRTHASLWWPAYGQDIDVRSLPSRPGKAIQFELKTTTINGGAHDVYINLLQLWRYRHLPFAEQPFYVFPLPNWPGLLEDHARAHGKEVTNLAYGRRSSPGWWFTDWMYVLTAHDVESLMPRLTTEPGKDEKRRLVRFTPSGPGRTATWGDPKVFPGGGPDPCALGLRAFLDRIDQCGDPSWPQVIRLPLSVVPDLDTVSHDTVLDLIVEMAQVELFARDQLVTFDADGQGSFHRRRPDDAEQSVGRVPADREADATENRQQLFVADRYFYRRRHQRR